MLSTRGRKKFRINRVSEGMYQMVRPEANSGLPCMLFAANEAHAELAAFSDPAHHRYPLASNECQSRRSLRSVPDSERAFPGSWRSACEADCF